MRTLPIPAHEDHDSFDSWIDAMLMAIPETDAPYPSGVVEWRRWARQLPLCVPFNDYMVPDPEMIGDWREWVDNLRMEVM